MTDDSRTRLYELDNGLDDAFLALQRALDGIGHSFSFDSRYKEITCTTCDWYAEAPFLDAVKLHAAHHLEKQLEVLDAFRATLMS